jgi:hypothetical protein
MKPMDAEDVKAVFRKVYLEENYAFLEEDLVKLANAFIEAATPTIARQERAMCVEYVRSLNTAVADALEAKRGPL